MQETLQDKINETHPGSGEEVRMRKTLKHYHIQIDAYIHAQDLESCFAKLAEDVMEQAQKTGEQNLSVTVGDEIPDYPYITAGVQVEIIPPCSGVEYVH